MSPHRLRYKKYVNLVGLPGSKKKHSLPAILHEGQPAPGRIAGRELFIPISHIYGFMSHIDLIFMGGGFGL